jgi:hypothetical protein
MKRFSGKKITVDFQVVCIWICACFEWQIDMAYAPFIERFQLAFSGFSGVKFDITANWTNLAKWIKVTFHSSPFCFGQPSFVQMRLTKLLSMLPNYSLHYTAASPFFCLVILGSVYNEQKPMWTCKQAINSLDAYTRTKLENNGLVDKFKNLLVSNFLPLWNWETLYTQSLYLQYGKEYVRIWAIIVAWVFTNWVLLELCIFMTASTHSVIEVSIHLAIGTPHFYDCFHWVLDIEIST